MMRITIISCLLVITIMFIRVVVCIRSINIIITRNVNLNLTIALILVITCIAIFACTGARDDMGNPLDDVRSRWRTWAGARLPSACAGGIGRRRRRDVRPSERGRG